MVYKYTGKLLADCFCQHYCCYGRINTAGQGTKHFAVSDFFTDCLNTCFHEGIHLPASGTSADVHDEVVKHLHTFLCMHYFGVELYRIQVFLYIFHCRNGTYRCMCRNGKISRCLFNIICVAHPADCFFGYAFKQLGLVVHRNLSFAVFADRCSCHFSSQHMRHELGTVADTKYGHTQFEHFHITKRGLFAVYAVGASCENNSLGMHFFQLVQRKVVRMHFTIYIAFSDSAGYQLVILTAEIENHNHFSIHYPTMPFVIVS